MKYKFLHIGVHNSLNKNAGDTLLFDLVRKTFEKFFFDVEWDLKQLWDPISENDIETINKKYHGIILGGGGVLLKDQKGADSSLSGWQWNIDVKQVDKIRVPLIVFAIGYNRFRNQEDFDEIFKHNITSVVSKSSFFGLRNSGSKKALKNYLSVELVKKLNKQFCPTTFANHLIDSDLKTYIGKEHTIAFNPAFDREEMRFGLQINKILNRLSLILKDSKKLGFNLILVAHKDIDLKMEKFLIENNVDYTLKNLTNSSSNEILQFYSSVSIAVGMRGHAQMIPFGLGTPIFSIVTHDKLSFFLEDIDKSEWGEELFSENLKNNLFKLLNKVKINRNKIQQEIIECQKKIWNETSDNMEIIKSIITAKIY